MRWGMGFGNGNEDLCVKIVECGGELGNGIWELGNGNWEWEWRSLCKNCGMRWGMGMGMGIGNGNE